VTVSNLVTDGPHQAHEDAPVRLSYAPKLCRSGDCFAPTPGLHSGDAMDHVMCQTAGDRITNGNDASRSDDKNPRLFESRLWYG
jgi:hypothetical protein